MESLDPIIEEFCDAIIFVNHKDRSVEDWNKWQALYTATEKLLKAVKSLVPFRDGQRIL